MPFIWDDLYWHIVSKDEEYDRNRFAVVRTLFVQLNAKYYYYAKVSHWSICNVSPGVYVKPKFKICELKRVKQFFRH